MERVTAVVTCMTDAERPFALEALRSVAAQTHPVRAIVCVTPENDWIEPLLGGIDGTVELLRFPLAPPGVIRNAATERARTDLVAYLDGDDVWAPSKVERQVAHFRDDLDVLGTKHLLVRDDGRAFFCGMARFVPMPSSWLVRRQFVLQQPFTDARAGEEMQVWNSARVVGRAAVLDRYLLRYRVRPGSLSEGTPSMLRKRRFEQRSRRPGARPVLLATSFIGAGVVRRIDLVRGSPIRRLR